MHLLVSSGKFAGHDASGMTSGGEDGQKDKHPEGDPTFVRPFRPAISAVAGRMTDTPVLSRGPLLSDVQTSD